jgi:hypothetical protein
MYATGHTPQSTPLWLCLMSDDQNKPSRPWKDIARELAQATNRMRALELAKELDRALLEQVPQVRKQ